MYDYLLPIGSVVRLKGATKLSMIIGVLQFDPKVPDRVLDYVAVLYPEGHYSAEVQLVFNHDAIEEIVFRGYEDEQRESFIKFLSLLGDKDNSEKDLEANSKSGLSD